MLYIWTSVWVLHTPNNGGNMLFNVFSCRKAKEKCLGNKTGFLQVSGLPDDMALLMPMLFA